MRQQTTGTFGGFINYRRIKLNMTLSDLSKELGISVTYLDLIENNKKINPSEKIIYEMARVFELSKEECYIFFDLHARANNTVSLDLPVYLMSNDMARKAVRRAKEAKNADEEWVSFINKLK